MHTLASRDWVHDCSRCGYIFVNDGKAAADKVSYANAAKKAFERPSRLPKRISKETKSKLLSRLAGFEMLRKRISKGHQGCQKGFRKRQNQNYSRDWQGSNCCEKGFRKAIKAFERKRQNQNYSRDWQGSNLRGETPRDFKSRTLTTRSQSQSACAIKCCSPKIIYSTIFFIALLQGAARYGACSNFGFNLKAQGYLNGHQ